MTFEEIMRNITSGLTGEPDHDLHYLQEQAEKYKDAEYGKEILRACGRLMYECIPDDKKQELNATFQKDHLGIEAAIEEANFNIYKGNLTTGEKILKDMVTRIESYNMFEDDSVSEYHTFSEPMEELLYEYLVHPQKDLRRAAEPFSELYLAYGSCLHGLGKYNKALESKKILLSHLQYLCGFRGSKFISGETSGENYFHNINSVLNERRSAYSISSLVKRHSQILLLWRTQ